MTISLGSDYWLPGVRLKCCEGYCIQAPNTFYVQLFCWLLKLVKSQRAGSSNYKSALIFVNLPYLRNKLMARKPKTLNLFQTTAQGEGNTQKFGGKASLGVTS